MPGVAALELKSSWKSVAMNAKYAEQTVLQHINDRLEDQSDQQNKQDDKTYKHSS